VSIAQYLREAALTRLVYASGRRGDDEFELALRLVSGDRAKSSGLDALEAAVVPPAVIESVEARASREGSEAAALAAQGRVARQRARELRELSAKRRRG
jgi:hypothetical protein